MFKYKSVNLLRNFEKAVSCPNYLNYLVLSDFSYLPKIKTVIMLNEVHREFKRYSKHCRSLKHIIDDTQSSLEEIHSSLQTVCKLTNPVID